MLAYIDGVLAKKDVGLVVIDCHGMGMAVQVPTSLGGTLPALGEKVKLYTHLHWREDGPHLYGFAQHAELELFGKLIGVSGIGPKGALAILSYASPERLLVWLFNEDVNQLRKIPGIGMKTAQRLILELKEKAAAAMDGVDISALHLSDNQPDSPLKQASEALMSLGYDSHQATRTIAAVQEDNPGANLETLIREGLRRLARA